MARCSDLDNAAEASVQAPSGLLNLGPRFHLIVSAKEASMSSWEIFLCRIRLKSDSLPCPH